MAQPRLRRDIFAVIKPESRIRSRGGNRQAGETWIQTEIERYNRLYPRVMRNAKYADYLDYVVEEIRKDLESTQREQDEAARTTPQEVNFYIPAFLCLASIAQIYWHLLVLWCCLPFQPFQNLDTNRRYQTGQASLLALCDSNPSWKVLWQHRVVVTSGPW